MCTSAESTCSLRLSESQKFSLSSSAFFFFPPAAYGAKVSDTTLANMRMQHIL